MKSLLIFLIIFLPVAANAARIFDGHDNGITAKDPVTNVAYLVTGDGPCPVGKCETALYRLPAGRSHQIERNWIFVKGYGGKCYGAIVYGKDLFLLISDRGSGREGIENCRILNVRTGRRSATLQSTLFNKGGNFFFFKAEGKVYIGSPTFPTHNFWAGKTPIRIWVGNPWSLKSFKLVTEDCGIIAPNATTMSVTFVPEKEQYLAAVGDIVTGTIYRFASTRVDGGWRKVGQTRYVPPMVSAPWSWEGAQLISGPFTENFLELDGQWYSVKTGSKYRINDAIFIDKVDILSYFKPASIAGALIFLLL